MDITNGIKGYMYSNIAISQDIDTRGKPPPERAPSTQVITIFWQNPHLSNPQADKMSLRIDPHSALVRHWPLASIRTGIRSLGQR